MLCELFLLYLLNVRRELASFTYSLQVSKEHATTPCTHKTDNEFLILFLQNWVSFWKMG